jgi:hypothetical protein
MHGALAEGALRRFQLQFEPEWIDCGPADGQLTFGFAWQNTTGQQATIGRLSRVVAPRDPSTTAHLFGQLADRVQEVDIVSAQLVDSLEGRQRRRFEALVTHQAPHYRPILLFDEAAVILAIGPSSGKRDALGCAVLHQRPIQELTATVGVQAQDSEGQTFVQPVQCGEHGLGTFVA